jgi:hypothetical protein
MTDFPLPHEATTPNNLFDFIHAILEVDAHLQSSMNARDVLKNSQLEDRVNIEVDSKSLRLRQGINFLVPLLQQMGWVALVGDKTFQVTDAMRSWHSASQSNPAQADGLLGESLQHVWFAAYETASLDQFIAQIQSARPDAEQVPIETAYYMAQMAQSLNPALSGMAVQITDAYPDLSSDIDDLSFVDPGEDASLELPPEMTSFEPDPIPDVSEPEPSPEFDASIAPPIAAQADADIPALQTSLSGSELRALRKSRSTQAATEEPQSSSIKRSLINPFGTDAETPATNSIPSPVSPLPATNIANLDVYEQAASAPAEAPMPRFKRDSAGSSSQTPRSNSTQSTRPSDRANSQGSPSNLPSFPNPLNRLERAKQQAEKSASATNPIPPDESKTIADLRLDAPDTLIRRFGNLPTSDSSPLDSLRRARNSTQIGSPTTTTDSMPRGPVDNRVYGPRAQPPSTRSTSQQTDPPAFIVLTRADNTRVEITREFFEWWQNHHQVSAAEALQAIHNALNEDTDDPGS